MQLKKTMQGVQDLGGAIKDLGVDSKRAFDSLSMSGKAVQAIEGLSDEIQSMGVSTTIVGSEISATARKMITASDRLTSIGGPLGDFVKTLTDVRETIKRDAETMRTAGSWGGKLLVRSALLVKGLDFMAKGAARAASAIVPFTVAYSDAAKQVIRGTPLMVLNTKALRENQWQVQQNAIAIKKATGLETEAAIELGAGIKGTLALVESSLDAQGVATFSQELAKSGKLAGMSAGEISDLNRVLMRGADVSARASKHIFNMIADVSRFGLSGQQATQLLKDESQRILSIKPKDREAFARQLLESAGLFTKAGIDFKQYAGKLLEAKGTDVYRNAGFMAAFGGGSVAGLVSIMRRAQLGDKGASVDLLRAQQKAFEGVQERALGGTEGRSRFEGIRSSLAAGKSVNTQDQNFYNTGLLKLETLLGSFGDRLGVDSVDTGMALGQKIADAQKALEGVQKEGLTGNQALAAPEAVNATSGERVEKIMADAASRFSQAANDMAVTAKVYSDAANRFSEAIGHFGGGIVEAIGGGLMALAGGGGILKSAWGGARALTGRLSRLFGGGGAAAEGAEGIAASESFLGMSGKLGSLSKLAARFAVPAVAAWQAGKGGFDAFKSVSPRGDLGGWQKTGTTGAAVVGSAFDTLATIDPTQLIGLLPGVHMEKGLLKATTNALGITEHGKKLSATLASAVTRSEENFNDSRNNSSAAVGQMYTSIQERYNALNALHALGHWNSGPHKNIDMSMAQVESWFASGARPEDLEPYMPGGPKTPNAALPEKAQPISLQKSQSAVGTVEAAPTNTEERTTANAQGVNKDDFLQRIEARLGEILDELRNSGDFVLGGAPNYT